MTTITISGGNSDLTLPGNIDSIVGGTGDDTITISSQISASSIDLGAGTDSLVLGNFINTVTVANTGSAAGSYTLSDTPGFASGVSFVANGTTVTTSGGGVLNAGASPYTPANGVAQQLSTTGTSIAASYDAGTQILTLNGLYRQLTSTLQEVLPLLGLVLFGALVLAGLAAEGETHVSGVHHVDRGYDDLVGAMAQASVVVAQLFPPSGFDNLPMFLKVIGETIAMAFLGTLLGLPKIPRFILNMTPIGIGVPLTGSHVRPVFTIGLGGGA